MILDIFFSFVFLNLIHENNVYFKRFYHIFYLFFLLQLRVGYVYSNLLIALLFYLLTILNSKFFMM